MNISLPLFRPARPISQLAFALTAMFWADAGSAADLATEVVGSWRVVSHTVNMGGRTFDSYAALLQQRPCANKFRYKVNADGTYRLDTSASVCDEKYRAMQEKVFTMTKWKVEGNKITTSATSFAPQQTYVVAVSGNRMTWTGTEGQGVLVFER
jgi:hypothetical protein